MTSKIKCSFYPPGTPWVAFGDNRSCITTDKMCPHRWQNLPHIRGRFCQMTHQHKIGYSVEISWDTTEPSLHKLKLLFLCNWPGKYQSPTIESVSTQTNLEKKWQKVVRSPLLRVLQCWITSPYFEGLSLPPLGLEGRDAFPGSLLSAESLVWITCRWPSHLVSWPRQSSLW